MKTFKEFLAEGETTKTLDHGEFKPIKPELNVVSPGKTVTIGTNPDDGLQADGKIKKLKAGEQFTVVAHNKMTRDMKIEYKGKTYYTSVFDYQQYSDKVKPEKKKKVAEGDVIQGNFPNKKKVIMASRRDAGDEWKFWTGVNWFGTKARAVALTKDKADKVIADWNMKNVKFLDAA